MHLRILCVYISPFICSIHLLFYIACMCIILYIIHSNTFMHSYMYIHSIILYSIYFIYFYMHMTFIHMGIPSTTPLKEKDDFTLVKLAKIE